MRDLANDIGKGVKDAGLVFLMMALFFTGCTRFIPHPADEPRARALAQRYAGLNGDLHQFKGLGQMQLETPTGSMAGRIAWAARLPDQLRMEWVTPMGQSYAHLVADGAIITIISPEKPKGYRLRQHASALEPLIHIPVGIETLLAFLVGRLPLPAYAAARIVREGDDFIEVALKNRWAVPIAVFEVDQVRQIPRTLSVFASDGELRYQVEWHQWHTVVGYLLPRRMVVAGGNGQRLVLGLNRYWCNVTLADETFLPTLVEPSD